INQIRVKKHFVEINVTRFHQELGGVSIFLIKLRLNSLISSITSSSIFSMVSVAQYQSGRTYFFLEWNIV
ncbi:MAG: hypothetical protein ACW98F_01805, partial [Candidatus Hodarchaeales archaeon]